MRMLRCVFGSLFLAKFENFGLFGWVISITQLKSRNSETDPKTTVITDALMFGVYPQQSD